MIKEIISIKNIVKTSQQIQTHPNSHIIQRGNFTLPTCDLARFNSAHPWFKSCHLTHLRWAPLDPRYPPLPFPLENFLYYISQN